MGKFNPQEFAEEYADRLRASKEYRPPSLFLPGLASANMGAEFKKLRENFLRVNPGETETGYGTPRGFMRRYQEEYFPQAQRLAQEANLPTISEEIDEFVDKTGLQDPRARDLGFFDLQDAKHEIISHMRPYKAGFMPDYRNLPAAVSGMPDFKSNPVSPLNERFAGHLDFMIGDNYLPGSPTNREFSRGRVKDMIAGGSGFENELETALRQQALDAGKPFAEVEPAVRQFMLENYPERGGQQNRIFKISDSVADEIADQLNKKYLPGAKYDFKQKGDLFYPSGGKFNDYFNNREGFQKYLMASTAEGVSDWAKRFSNPGTNYMGTLIPFVSPDAINTKALAKAAKFSAVDFIPSRQAVRDFAQGDVKQGATRMAREYVQGIPAAITAGVALSSLPAQVAAVANPIGAGVAGGIALTRAGEALDEVSRQQTGEGLLTKIQHTIHKVAGPGFGRPNPTGSAYRGSEDPRATRARAERTVRNIRQGTWTPPPTPEIRQITPAQARASQPPRAANEWERRTRLFQQRFNPSRGEFGLTELLFGR